MNKKFVGQIIFLLLIYSASMLNCYSKTEQQSSPVNQTQTVNIAIEANSKLTIDNCINIALQNNPNIAYYENMQKVSKSKIGQARSNYLPQVTANPSFTRQQPIAQSYMGANTFNRYSALGSVNQLIFDFGKTPALINTQKQYYIASEFDLKYAVLQISYNVKTAYYNALRAEVEQNVYRDTIKQREEHLAQAKSFFELGTKPKIDVTTAEMNLSNAKLDYIKALNLYETAISNLNNAMGYPTAPKYKLEDTYDFKRPNFPPIEVLNIAQLENEYKKQAKTVDVVLKSSVQKNDLIDDVIFKKTEITLDDALKKAFDNRPDLKALEAKSVGAKKNVVAVKANYYPSVNGFATYGYGQQQNLDWGNTWSFGGQIDIPVFNGLKTKYLVDEAKANLEVANSSVEILKQNIYNMVQKSYISLSEAEKKIPVSQLSVKQARESFELASGRYTIGAGNYIELQDAETNYKNAQLSYVQALYDYNIAKTNLDYAMGAK